MDNINIKVNAVINNAEIIEFMVNNKPANSEKEGDENYEMYKYLMENVFRKPQEKKVENVAEKKEEDAATKKEEEPKQEQEQEQDKPQEQ